MRTFLIAVVGLGLGLSAAAQVPPKNAVDITHMPAAAPQSAPAASTTLDAPASVVRVYISNLAGADASALQGLLTQALFESKQVVITENQANASLTLQGQVVRQPVPTPDSNVSTRDRKHKSRASHLPDGTDPAVIKDLDAVSGLALSNAVDLDDTGGSGTSSLPGLGLNGLGNLVDSPADLRHYQFRLDLQLISPNGDLVWMSGQGDQAPPFAAAGGAVTSTVQPLLAAIAKMSPPAPPQP